MPRPVSRRSLSEEVYEQLADEILRGELDPGTALPSERELAAVLGVNRGAVREALKRLAQTGLVATRHGGATTVLDYRRTGSLDVLPRLLFRADGTIDHDVARSALEMRAALAPDVARLAALRHGDDDHEAIAALADRLAATAPDDVAAQSAVSLEIWDRLVQAAGNIAYQLAFADLRRVYEPMRPLLARVLGPEVGDVDGHRALVAAVLARDAPAADAAARMLLARSTDALLRLVEALGEG